MTDQPELRQPDSSNSVTTVSGGVNVDAAQVNVGNPYQFLWLQSE